MSPHKVPVHLDQKDGIGRFTFRQIFLVGGALFYVAPIAWSLAPANGPSLGDTLHEIYPGLGWIFQPGSIPLFPLLYAVVACAPFFIMALPLDPPVEHGLLASIAWVFRHGYVNAEQMREYLGRVTVSGERVNSDFGIGAMWELPGRNLRLDDVASVEVAEDLWGEFLNGLTAPAQTLTVANRIDPEIVVGRIETYAPGKQALRYARNGRAASYKESAQSTPERNSRAIAKWLRDDVKNRHLIERRHFLAVFAEDDQAYTDSEIEIADGLSGIGFRVDLIRRLEGQELREVIDRTWTLGVVPDKGQLGPLDRAFIASDCIYIDGLWHSVIAIGKWMRLVRDNALAPLIDGPYEVDVIQHIRPIEADEIVDDLERKADAMTVTAGRRRKRAVIDLEEFLAALHDGVESPFDVSILLHIKAPEKKAVQTEAKRITKRIRRSGARAKSLRWEQRGAIQAVAPLGISQLQRRTKRVDTSSVKRLYPWTASSMWMEDAIPWGETIDSRRPVGLNVWRRPLIPNPHIVCYMLSGGGKGFGWKVWSSRALFGRLTQEFFGFDQAIEDLQLGEYGRWAEYCGIEYRHVKSPDDFKAALADLDNYKWLGPGIEWNIAQLPVTDRPQFLALVKQALWQRASMHPARRQWAIDELWSFVKLEERLGIDPYWLAQCQSAIEDLIRTGRHVKVGGAFFTQRAKDSLNVPLMEIIQSQASIQIYGMQNPSEITDIAGRLHWTDADIATIKRFSPGQQIVSAGPWRVAMRVTASDDEFEMANTDGGPRREDTLPSSAEERSQAEEEAA